MENRDDRGAPKRKPLEQLLAELAEIRPHVGRPFVHAKSGQTFQLLFGAFDEHSNEFLAVYCLLAHPALKFTRPMSEFLEKFEPGHGI